MVMDFVERWCVKEIMSVTQTKTSPVPFTRKRKPFGIRELDVFGTPLKVDAEVKYLEMTLNNKLIFKVHL